MGTVFAAPPVHVDVCPNIAGDQATVPAGMVKDAHGNCVTPAVSVVIIDLCLNVAGVQTTVPAGLVRDAHGNCVAVPAHGTGTTPVHGTVTHELPFTGIPLWIAALLGHGLPATGSALPGAAQH